MRIILSLCCAMLSLTACSEVRTTHGHVLNTQQVAALEPGKHSKNDVMRLLGSPSTKGTFNENIWMYVTDKTRSEALNPNILEEREVLVLRFEKDKLAEVTRKTGEDGREVEPSNKVTPTQGQSLGIIDQMIENLGRGF